MITMNNDYIGKVLRHFVKLVLIVGVLFVAMHLTGTLAIAPADLIGGRGFVLLVAVVAISATYPAYGFTSYTIEGDYESSLPDIHRAMLRCGYKAEGRSAERVVFRATSPLKRLRYLGGDDKVVVEKAGANLIAISGVRREAEQARFRICGELSKKE